MSQSKWHQMARICQIVPGNCLPLTAQRTWDFRVFADSRLSAGREHLQESIPAPTPRPPTIKWNPLLRIRKQLCETSWQTHSFLFQMSLRPTSQSGSNHPSLTGLVGSLGEIRRGQENRWGVNPLDVHSFQIRHKDFKCSWSKNFRLQTCWKLKSKNPDTGRPRVFALPRFIFRRQCLKKRTWKGWGWTNNCIYIYNVLFFDDWFNSMLDDVADIESFQLVIPQWSELQPSKTYISHVLKDTSDTSFYGFTMLHHTRNTFSAFGKALPSGVFFRDFCFLLMFLLFFWILGFWLLWLVWFYGFCRFYGFWLHCFFWFLASVVFWLLWLLASVASVVSGFCGFWLVASVVSWLLWPFGFVGFVDFFGFWWFLCLCGFVGFGGFLTV